MRLRVMPVVLIAIASLMFAACGADGGNRTESAKIGESTEKCPDGVASVKVSFVPVAYIAPAEAAVDEGLFEKHCLKVQKAAVATQSAVSAALESGDLTFAIYNLGQAVAAASQGLDLHAVMPGFYSGTDSGVYALKGSGITSVADLKGKTVALGSIQSNTHAGFLQQLEDAGVDPDSVKVVLVPIPELLASLTSGQYDAAQVPEPWITLGGDKITPIMKSIHAPFGKHALVTLWTSTDTFNESHPEVVANFQAAMKEAVDLVNSDPKVLRQAILNGTEIPPQAVDAMPKPYFSTNLDMESIKKQVAAMEKYGFFKSKPDLEALFD